MKYYAALVDLGCFSREDAVKLTGSTESANSMLYTYKKKGLIESIRRDMYVTISLETNQPIPSRYAVACRLSEGAYISHHSAFEYYGLANQVYHEVYVSAQIFFRTFDYDGVTYRRVKPRINMGVETKRDGVRITDTERTVLDGINDFERIAGLEELLRCMELVPYLNGEKLLSYLAEYKSGFLYQKAGFILEHYQKEFRLPDSFFDECRINIPQGKRYFYNGIRHDSSVLYKDWLLYAPKDLMRIIRKGEGYIE